MRIIVLILCVLLPSILQAQTTSIMMLGDSLVSGYKLPKNKSLPKQIEDLLIAQGYDVEVINEGVSGNKMADGAKRITKALQRHEPDMVILLLGGNDVLRKTEVEEVERHLQTIMEAINQWSIPVVIAGIEVPWHRGISYAYAFDSIYEDAAEDYGALLYPSILDGVYGEDKYMQTDRIHPNRMGIAIMAKALTPLVIEALDGLEVGEF